MRQLKEQGLSLGHKSAIGRAIQCRLQPSPDPLGTTYTKKTEPLGTTYQNGTTFGTTSEPLPEAQQVQRNQRVYLKGTRGSVPESENLENWNHPTPAHPNPDHQNNINIESELW